MLDISYLEHKALADDRYYLVNDNKQSRHCDDNAEIESDILAFKITRIII